MQIERSLYLLLLAVVVSFTAAEECAESTCIAENEGCTHNPEGCCDGLGCFGYNFFKRCRTPPACLAEWYDCSNSMPCCGDLVCAVTEGGASECQVRTLETNLTGADLISTSAPFVAPVPVPVPAPLPTPVAAPVAAPVAPVKIPTPAPTLPPTGPNLKTTAIPGAAVKTKTACAVGDPHIYSFDGLAYDCQAEGEFTLMKSTITQREVQGRFAFFADIFSPGWAWAVVKGFVTQDEGDTPKVELSFPIFPDSFAPNTIGQENCKVLFYVDGVQRDLNDGSGSPKVKVTWTRKTVEILYTASQFKVTANVAYANGCYFEVCTHVPDVDKTTGMFGSADGDTSNDWKTRDGELLPVPASLTDRLRWAGYDYCTTHWCIREQADSLFAHKELGLDWFEDIMHCNLPHGSTVEEYLRDVDPKVIELCKNEIMCIIDARLMGVEAAASTVASRKAVATTCNGKGGECDVSSCCNGLKCAQVNGFAKECVINEQQCVGEWANCGTLTPCCGNLKCVQQPWGPKTCMDLPTCMPEWRSCKDVGCCNGLKCVDLPDGTAQCRNLPTCMPEWQDCSLGVDCCNGLKCITDVHSQRKTCRNVPTCQAHEWQVCSADFKCCDGLTCVTEYGRSSCRKLPKCVNEWQSCAYVGCCQDGPKPLKCVSFTDSQGFATSQCQAACASNWGQCSADQPCCDSTHTCQGGICKPKPTCGGNWQQCTSELGCCDTSYTCQSGTCKPKPTCGNDWQPCTSTLGCCNSGYACTNGTCQPNCAFDWNSCSSTKGCCSKNYSCQGGQCKPTITSCANDWQPCSTGAGCCNSSRFACKNGQCQPSCAPQWNACSSTMPCCDTTRDVCTNGQCRPK
ncbi:hypothetical protein FisN_7Hh404 [Fistulifera solaris]|uniref:VWFD domain-containing protein n=1 Tax=Fistulifera solaris TaxID=1519565 RepID=A0A1Z5KSD0_FISSO|nr:hypothetical protein FisN_7Hh404 [Fistulifera solaris]|eukprot:GAX29005.1 hypothetical protein FisN_7Hh404 [Fistulifera solaris]